jgi:hypothetical protein
MINGIPHPVHPVYPCSIFFIPLCHDWATHASPLQKIRDGHATTLPSRRSAITGKYRPSRGANKRRLPVPGGKPPGYIPPPLTGRILAKSPRVDPGSPRVDPESCIYKRFSKTTPQQRSWIVVLSRNRFEQNFREMLYLIIVAISRICRRRAGRSSRAKEFGPSHNARSGHSWVSRKSASTPTATAARARGAA